VDSSNSSVLLGAPWKPALKKDCSRCKAGQEANTSHQANKYHVEATVQTAQHCWGRHGGRTAPITHMKTKAQESVACRNCATSNSPTCSHLAHVDQQRVLQSPLHSQCNKNHSKILRYITTLCSRACAPALPAAYPPCRVG
jgi:predicted metal-binding protein